VIEIVPPPPSPEVPATIAPPPVSETVCARSSTAPAAADDDTWAPIVPSSSTRRTGVVMSTRPGLPLARKATVLEIWLNCATDTDSRARTVTSPARPLLKLMLLTELLPLRVRSAPMRMLPALPLARRVVLLRTTAPLSSDTVDADTVIGPLAAALSVDDSSRLGTGRPGSSHRDRIRRLDRDGAALAGPGRAADDEASPGHREASHRDGDVSRAPAGARARSHSAAVLDRHDGGGDNDIA